MNQIRPAPMTVAQLKAALLAFPDDMLVMVDGYEGGVDNCAAPEVKEIHRHWPEESNYLFGRYELVDTPAEREQIVVLLSRYAWEVK